MAGSIYQWSKRLSNRTLGWFTGWMYFWARVVTVTAVAVIVPFVIDGIRARSTLVVARRRRLPGLDNMFLFTALLTLVDTTLINVYGVRLLSIINNIGVAAEILGMFVFALILLFFANHQSPSILFDTACTSGLAGRRLPAGVRVGMFMSLFILYGFDTAGTFGEETVDAEPAGAARRPVRDLAVRHRRRVFLLAVILAAPRHRRRDGRGPGVRVPDRRHDPRERAQGADRRRSRSASCTCSSSSTSVFVCTLAIQGASDPDDVLDGPRPAPAVRRALGPGQPDASRRRPTRRSPSACWPRCRSSSRPARRLLHVDRGHRPDLHQPTSCATSACSPRAAGLAAQGGLVQASGAGARSINILALV